MLGPAEDALTDTEHPLTPAQQERVETIYRSGQRLLKLVNTLLDFSRLEAGRIDACYEPTDLASLTSEVASVFREVVERAGLRLVVDCPPLPEPVYVDRGMWEHIVLSLLSNAFKFTFEGGSWCVRPSIAVAYVSRSAIRAPVSGKTNCPSCSRGFTGSRAREPGPMRAPG